MLLRHHFQEQFHLAASKKSNFKNQFKNHFKNHLANQKNHNKNHYHNCYNLDTEKPLMNEISSNTITSP